MVTTEPTDFGYTGMHAFVFIDSVDPGTNIRTVVNALREFGPPPRGPVMFASEMVGSSLGFAHLRVEDDDLAGLQGLIANELWDRGVHCSYCIEAETARRGEHRQGVKRQTPEIIAIVRIRAQQGALDGVLGRLADPEGPLKTTFKGASVVYGDIDILLQLGGNDFSTVARAVYGPLQDIEGIADTDTLFTDARRYDV